MNCREFESLSRDMGCNQGISEDVCQKALAHVESCTRCKERLDEERTLSARLHLLAASMERERAPVELETILISTYRQRISSDRPSLSILSQSSYLWVWRTGRSLMEVAAVILLCAVSLQLLLTLPPSLLPTYTEEPAKGPVVTPRGVQSPLVELTTDFIPLVPCVGLDCFEGGQLVRVAMPRIALIFLGLPMNEQLAQEPVTADVLIGGDGVARAIRFVR
jgi:hypothetical protein